MGNRQHAIFFLAGAGQQGPDFLRRPRSTWSDLASVSTACYRHPPCDSCMLSRNGAGVGVRSTAVPPVAGTRKMSELPGSTLDSPAKANWVPVGDQKTWLGNQAVVCRTTSFKAAPLGLIVHMPPPVNA